jgi:hypothetical protein
MHRTKREYKLQSERLLTLARVALLHARTGAITPLPQQRERGV